MEIINVIKEPYFNHKRTGTPSKNKFVLTFLVDKRANKIMIKKAFHAVFGIKVHDVNTVTKHPKPARMTAKSRKNFTKAKKVAYISLSKEDFLNLKKAIEGEAAIPEELLKAQESAMQETEVKESEPVDSNVAVEEQKASDDKESSGEPKKARRSSKAQKSVDDSEKTHPNVGESPEEDESKVIKKIDTPKMKDDTENNSN
ncbi:50S ribosomal protein L23 [Candidatus Mycoplasma haematolamae str. Purdue]|uniref:Large ribosomal subunit protein uL23 n=1 Tax=Mycoplasma haematolamae (strain Purdue) TaxID=1212765 RepID=I7CF95_MYCHA|nr:50S ribosomal protein L23 [Candidatus Mycoplasma haematolamae]AFO51916.1 50S ribosomal protein L23 [Candidatus Mycoplasma haematolamae str. Purdue]